MRVCESKPRCERLIEPSSWFPPKPPQGGRSGLTSVRPCGSLASSASLGWPRRPDFGQALWLPGLQSIFLLGWPRRPDFGQALWLPSLQSLLQLGSGGRGGLTSVRPCGPRPRFQLGSGGRGGLTSVRPRGSRPRFQLGSGGRGGQAPWLLASL